MFGRIIKAALMTPIAWLLAYVVGRVAEPMLKVMQAGPTDGGKTVEYLSLVVENTLLLFLLSMLMLLIAGAVAERRIAGGGL